MDILRYPRALGERGLSSGMELFITRQLGYVSVVEELDYVRIKLRTIGVHLHVTSLLTTSFSPACGFDTEAFTNLVFLYVRLHSNSFNYIK